MFNRNLPVFKQNKAQVLARLDWWRVARPGFTKDQAAASIRHQVVIQGVFGPLNGTEARRILDELSDRKL